MGVRTDDVPLSLLGDLTDEAARLAGEIRLCREQLERRAAGAGAGDLYAARGAIEYFERRLGAVALRRSELLVFR